MRRAVAVVVVSVLLALSPPPIAAKGGGHGSAAGGSKGTGTKGPGSSKPVHVKAYTKKDGTRVEAHDRKAPEPKSESATGSTTTHNAAPIRIYTDPVTGRKTLTNEPAPPLASRSLTTATTMRLAGHAPSMAFAPSIAPITVSRAATPTPLAHSTANGVPRDAKGRIVRSESAKHAFEVQTGYPHGRPGYVVDHIKPLACGGADAPSNMQWQTIAAAKAKDKTERAGCR